MTSGGIHQKHDSAGHFPLAPEGHICKSNAMTEAKHSPPPVEWERKGRGGWRYYARLPGAVHTRLRRLSAGPPYRFRCTVKHGPTGAVRWQEAVHSSVEDAQEAAVVFARGIDWGAAHLGPDWQTTARGHTTAQLGPGMTAGLRRDWGWVRVKCKGGVILKAEQKCASHEEVLELAARLTEELIDWEGLE